MGAQRTGMSLGQLRDHICLLGHLTVAMQTWGYEGGLQRTNMLYAGGQIELILAYLLGDLKLLSGPPAGCGGTQKDIPSIDKDTLDLLVHC